MERWLRRVWLIFFCLVFLCMACESSKDMRKMKQTDRFDYFCTEKDAKVLEDLNRTLETACPAINDRLEFVYDERITVMIYPDQKSYDESLTDKSVTGSPACSGNGTIKMVSPASPIKISGIPYDERLKMAAHEYVHLMMDEINKDIPVWLDEGLASFEGSRSGYEELCRLIFDQLPEIDFSQLENSYYELQAPDIYSFTAVKYILESFGYEKLNPLIRNPESFERILSLSKTEFNRKWKASIREKYRKSAK